MILHLFTIFGLSYFLKEAEGPFGIISKTRAKLFSNKYVGYLFFSLFECYFCLGCHMGWIFYLFTMDKFSTSMLFAYLFAGGAFSMLASRMLLIGQSFSPQEK